MKKPNTFYASNSLIGAIIILSLLGTATMTGFEAVSDLMIACKCQWQLFNESLSMMQPHRMVLPN